MKVPITVKLVVLTLGATAFYTWVGQLVPQKEVHPPEVTEIAEDVSTEEMVEIGEEIFVGKGICATCHTIGQSGALRFPDLDGIATRAGNRVPGLGQIEYLAQSLYEPNAYIVPGFNPGMPPADEPPVALSDGEIKAVIAYLQTLGGEATVTMATRLPYGEGADPTTDVDPAGGGEVAVADAGREAPDETGTAVGPAGATPDPATLLERYGCTGCHGADGGATSLAELGSRLPRDEILAGLVVHDPPLADDFESRVTLAEIRTLAEHLAAGGGGGGP